MSRMIPNLKASVRFILYCFRIYCPYVAASQQAHTHVQASRTDYGKIFPIFTSSGSHDNFRSHSLATRRGLGNHRCSGNVGLASWPIRIHRELCHPDQIGGKSPKVGHVETTDSNDARQGTHSSRPQTTPSHTEKRSGEPSRISWASAHFLQPCHLAMFKTFNTKRAQIRYRYSSRDKIFTVVREVLRNNYQSRKSYWSLPLLGNKPKKFHFVHQTVSHWEVHMCWARD